MDLDDLLAHQQKDIEGIKHGLDETRTGLDTMALTLQQLSAGQEALELQTALLSSEAENESPKATVSPGATNDAAVPIKALERLQSKLSELTQALQTSAMQGETRSAKLESRGEKLQGVVQRLENETPNLRHGVSPANHAGPPVGVPDAPQQADLAEDAWRNLVDHVSALKAAADSAEIRIAALEQRREALDETLKALSLQQVRNDQDVRQFRTYLKRLAVLSATAALLAAGCFAWLVSRA